MEPSPEFTIAVICTGNRFRSPLVEALLRQETQGLPVSVHSFGTLDLGAAPALPEALAAASRLGLDLSTHRARGIRQAHLADADLVLGFERAHIVTAVADGGAPPERTFTLPELVELLERSAAVELDDPVGRARELVAQADRVRAQPGLPGATELGDPLGQPDRVFRETETTLHNLANRLVRLLFGKPNGAHR